eukprot:348524_1
MATKQRLSSIELKDLESKFAATLVVSSLLSKRGIPCTISNLSKQVSQMCNNQSLTLTDLQMIHHIVPSICYIQSVQPNQTHNDQSHDQNASYQLKFCVPITPNNISKLVNKFTNALSNMQRTESKKRKRNATHENDDDLGPPHKKKRTHHHSDNTNNSHQTQTDRDADVIEFNLKPLPPSSTFRTAKQLKTLQFEALSFIEQSKNFTFWSNGSIVSSKLVPQKAPQYAALNLEDAIESPTSIQIRQIPGILISTYKDVQHMDIMHGLYTHQANAIQSICRGYHNIIATSTSSGKSLIYNIAVLSHIIHHKSQNLYLFPTKALAQDQLRSLNKICLHPNINISCATYDGDMIKKRRESVAAGNIYDEGHYDYNDQNTATEKREIIEYEEYEDDGEQYDGEQYHDVEQYDENNDHYANKRYKRYRGGKNRARGGKGSGGWRGGGRGGGRGNRRGGKRGRGGRNNRGWNKNRGGRGRSRGGHSGGRGGYSGYRGRYSGGSAGGGYYHDDYEPQSSAYGGRSNNNYGYGNYGGYRGKRRGRR